MITFNERNELTKAALAKVNHAMLNEEVEHFLSVDDDEQRPHDYYDAVTQAYELAEYHSERSLMTACRRVLIELGYYEPTTKEELAKWSCWSGSTGRSSKMQPDFTLKGVLYIFKNHVNVSDPESGHGANDE